MTESDDNGVEKSDGAADGNRTHDLRLTKASLYPLATAAVVSGRIQLSYITIIINGFKTAPEKETV